MAGEGALKALLWLIVIGGVAGYAYTHLRKAPEPEVEPEVAIATPTPTPATPVPATPAPVVVAATPTPAPVALATPTPTVAPTLDAATVSRTPTLWPPQVVLTQAHPFPIVVNGTVAGSAQAGAGTVLRVLRVGPQQVEVEFQSARHIVPIASTDLMARSLAIFRKNGSVLPVVPNTAVAAATAAATPTLSPSAVPARAFGAPVPNPVKLGERLVAEVVRNKRSRIEGGDWDDKMDRIELKVKIANTDPQLSMSGLKGEIFVFAESILDRSAVKLLISQTFDLSLAPRGTFEFMTSQVDTAYDTTGARFGHKYEGWVLRLWDSAGAVVLSKATSPNLLKLVEHAGSMSKDATYDRTKYTAKSEVR